MTKTTRRAFLSSVVALVICLTMLIGTTFAWFTDTASTAVNTIVSGNLDVDLEVATQYEVFIKDNGEIGLKNIDGWESAVGQTLDFVKAEGHENEEILWEPGCTYVLPPIRVVNNGNLSLKFKVAITGIDGDAKLNDVIEWIVPETYNYDYNDTAFTLDPGAFAAFKIAGHMKEDAGNEYQGLSINGIAITVYATQAVSEYDSIDNTYDADATLPDIWDGETTELLTQDEDGVYHIATAAQFVDYMISVNKNDGKNYYNVVLDNDIDLGGRTIEFSGSSQAFSGTFDGQNHTVSNYVIKRADTCAYTALFSCGSWAQDGRVTTIKNLTVKNGTVISNGPQVAAIIPNAEQSGTIVDNCHAIDCTVIGEKKVGAVVAYVVNGTVSNCSAENCNVYCTDSRENQATVYGYNNGGTFTNNAEPVNCNVVFNAKLVSTADDLRAALTPHGQGSDLGTILLTNDITVENWTAISANYTSFVLDGNGHSISGLTDALINAVGPNCNVTIKNLTVKNININKTAPNTIGAALINEVNNEGSNTALVIDNCHVVGGTINVHKYAGGLVGHIGQGNNNTVEVKNSTVTNVTITTADSSVGGLIGHTFTATNITNCEVKGSTISCTEDRNGGAAKAGSLVGTVNANTTTITNCTVNSTVTNVNSAAPVANGMVGRCYGTVDAN